MDHFSSEIDVGSRAKSIPKLYSLQHVTSCFSQIARGHQCLSISAIRIDTDDMYSEKQ